MDRKPKTVFQLDSPFTENKWPELLDLQEEAVVELLCNILSPIGRHRSTHVQPPEGRRRKRKRASKKLSENKDICDSPVPDIASFVLVGLNSISRHLELLARSSKEQTGHDDLTCPKAFRDKDPHQVQTDEAFKTQKPGKPLIQSQPGSLCQHFSLILVLQSAYTPSSLLKQHFPPLVFAASLAHPDRSPTKLVQVRNSLGPQLAAALGIQRVSIVGVLDGAPSSQSLVEFVNQVVPDIHISWLDEAMSLKYMPVKVNALETSAPTISKKDGSVDDF